MAPDDLSDEDKALFRQLAGKVIPLKNSKRIEVISDLPSAVKNTSSILQSPSIYYLSDNFMEEVRPETVLSYSKQDLPSKRLQQLKNGKIKREATLDLHGLGASTSKELLIKFIIEQTALTHRCLLIIHGKGGHQGEIPILKNLVNHWLPQFPQVLAFHSALARDGGSGALYVLLKRLRAQGC